MIKKFFKKSLLFSFIFTIAIFSNCKKLEQGQLIGTWEYINLYDINSPNIQRWTFYKNGNLSVVTNNTAQPQFSYTMLGNYKVIYRIKNTVVKISDLSQGEFNVNWEIRKLNEDVLVLFSNVNGNYLLKEFKRVKSFQ